MNFNGLGLRPSASGNILAGRATISRKCPRCRGREMIAALSHGCAQADAVVEVSGALDDLRDPFAGARVR